MAKQQRPAGSSEPVKQSKNAIKFAAIAASYKLDPNKTLRKVNFQIARKLVGSDLTWPGFCDMKVQLFTEFWEGRKSRPPVSQSMRIATPEQLAKRQQQLEKARARIAKLEAALAPHL